MRLINADNINCENLPRKLYPHLKDILDFIDSQTTIQAIPLDKVKQAREEIDNLYEDFDGYDPNALCEYSSRVDEILDKLIAESEGE